jgi:uncharacterized ParB-like nuclease family protein
MTKPVKRRARGRGKIFDEINRMARKRRAAMTEEQRAQSNHAIRPIPIRLIQPWRCTATPDWRDYAAAMRAGDVFPPIWVLRQSSKLHGYPYQIFDGMHRTRAAKHIGRRTIAAHVAFVERPGGKAEPDEADLWEVC